MVEVVARASWSSWRASSFGTCLEDLGVPKVGATAPVTMDRKASVMADLNAQRRNGFGPHLVATGFFDPRGVGVPAEIGASQTPLGDLYANGP